LERCIIYGCEIDTMGLTNCKKSLTVVRREFNLKVGGLQTA
jgi:hypothetical protein